MSLAARRPYIQAVDVVPYGARASYRDDAKRTTYPLKPLLINDLSLLGVNEAVKVTGKSPSRPPTGGHSARGH